MSANRFKYELYTDHEMHEHRYVVLSPEGYDLLLGEHVPLWDAAGVVQRENAILDICTMPEILAIVEELREANETPMVWIDELLHHPDVSDVHLRALVRRPAYLRSLVAWIDKQEIIHSAQFRASKDRYEANKALDHTLIKYTIANMLEAPVTVERVTDVYNQLIELNSTLNLQEFATNPMFLNECISHIISEL